MLPMKKLLITFALFLTGSLLMSQAFVFSVLANKGDNKIQQGTTSTALKAGTKILKGNSITVVSGGYIGLMHSSGKTIEIQTPGSYTIAQFESKLATQTTSFGQKYAQFAINNGGGSTKSYNQTGSVSRAVYKAETYTSDSIVIIPTIPLTLALGIERDDLKDSMNFAITDFYGRPISNKNITDDYFVLDLTKYKFKTSILAVSATAQNSFEVSEVMPPVMIYLKNDAEANQIKAEYDVLVKEMDMNNPLSHVSLASFFESYKMYDYATGHLKMASVLAPDVPDFKNLMMETIERNHRYKKSPTDYSKKN